MEIDLEIISMPCAGANVIKTIPNANSPSCNTMKRIRERLLNLGNLVWVIRNKKLILCVLPSPHPFTAESTLVAESVSHNELDELCERVQPLRATLQGPTLTNLEVLMLKTLKRCLVFLLAFPIAALADPVEVTARSNGTFTTDAQLMSVLGLDPAAPNSAYALTVRSFIDPGAAGFEDYGYWVAARESALDFTLELGGQTYHYSGNGRSIVEFRPNDQMVFNIAFDPPESSGAAFELRLGLIGWPGIGYGSPLQARSLENSATLFGSAAFAAYPLEVGSPGRYLEADVNVLSLQVSPVPEPASFGMLAGGILALALWGRRRWVLYRCCTISCTR